MPTTTRLLNALRTELVNAAIVRIPSVAGALPPMWLMPQAGTPAPGEGNSPTAVGTDAVVSAAITGGVPISRFESFMRWPFVEVRFRTTKGFQAEDLERQITAQIIDRVNFDLGGALRIIECEQTIPLQFLGSDEQGFEHLTTYGFQLYAP
jgi:hypothetical protein